MVLDQGGVWMSRIEYGLQAAAYPLRLAVNSPSAAWRWTQQSFETRASLQVENTRLRDANQLLQLQMLRYAALDRENAALRGLRDRLPGLAEKWLPGEVISTESSTLRQRIVVNRGARNGVFKGQTVIAKDGLLGQTLRVGPWSAEVILIADPEHAVPVQIVRNGLRTIAVGSGEASTLALPYLPIQSDVKEGDVLVTSGIGGVFPAGYPVGRITEVRRDGSSPLAQVRAVPFAGVDREREVMFIWFREQHPAAPSTSGDPLAGDPSVRPMPVVALPKPQGVAPAPATAAPAPVPGTAPAAPATPTAPPPAAQRAPATAPAPAPAKPPAPAPATTTPAAAANPEAAR